MTKEEVKQTILDYHMQWEQLDPVMDHNDAIAEQLEMASLDLICQFALDHDFDPLIGNYKLSYLFNIDTDEFIEETGEVNYELIYAWLDGLQPDKPDKSDKNGSDGNTGTEQDIGELVLFFYSSFWPDFQDIDPDFMNK